MAENCYTGRSVANTTSSSGAARGCQAPTVCVVCGLLDDGGILVLGLMSMNKYQFNLRAMFIIYPFHFRC